MSNTARNSILARVRRAQLTGRIPGFTTDRRAASVASSPAARAQPAAPPRREVTLQRFLDELARLGVDYHVEPTIADVWTRVAGIVGGRSVLSWDNEVLPYELGRMWPNAANGSSPRERQAAAEIGVTGCDAAIAETGSIVLLSGSGKPRSASLLPPIHLAVVRRNELRFSMGEFFKEFAGAIAAAACCTFVTGPSRTADIELTLTVGVHGPGKVIVVMGP
jgi:L-lactate dehydrogenase complex protein LldG